MGVFDRIRKRLESDDTKVTTETNFTGDFSRSILNEIVERIKNMYNIALISDTFIEKLEKYPDLVDILLRGGVSDDIIFNLNYYDQLVYLPNKEKDLEFVKFFEYSERVKKQIDLLNNRVTTDSISDEYICCYLDLSKEKSVIEYHNRIDSFLPGIEINFEQEKLIKTDIYSPFIIYLPKTRNRIVFHNFNEFISGNLELDENVIIQMGYDRFRMLDENILTKITKCKIVFSNDVVKKNNVQIEQPIDYKLVKYNHLIYIVENSSLNKEFKERVLFQIKSMYYSNQAIDIDLHDIITRYLSRLSSEEIKRLSKLFEDNINIYKTKKIEKPQLNSTYYVDMNFPNIETASVQEVINFINSLPNDLKYRIIKEPRICRKLDLPSDLSDDLIEKIIIVFEKRLPITIREFISSLDFDVKEFMSKKDNDCQPSYMINAIVSNYGIFDHVDTPIEVSIADILGHDRVDRSGSHNILETFDMFFEKNGDGYHTRALGLLEYKSGEELLSALKNRGNDTSDMVIQEIEKGKYIISANGLHRYSVLRFHYLLDKMKSEKSDEELRELYKIPVRLYSTVNYEKTYCNYLLQIFDSSVTHISFNPKSDEVTIYRGENKQIIRNNQLMYLTAKIVNSNELDNHHLSMLEYYYDEYASFKAFIDNYFPDLIKKKRNSHVVNAVFVISDEGGKQI